MDRNEFRTFHVSPDGDGWKITYEATQTLAGTREEAVEAAVHLAQGLRPAQVRIYNPDGELEEERVLSTGPYSRSIPKPQLEAPPPQKRIAQQR